METTSARSTEARRFRLQGLDCAQCAANIETALRKIEGLEGAVVSYATESLSLPTAHLAVATEVLARVEPDVQIVLSDSEVARETPSGERDYRTTVVRIARIGASVILLGIGIIFNQRLHDTPYSLAEYGVLIAAYLLVGAPVLIRATRNIAHGRVFNEMFLMSIATLGAVAIHKLPEAVAVMLFYSVGEYFQDLAVARSRRSISALMDLRPESARIVSEDSVSIVSPEDVEIGAVIEVLPGERVPLDGEVVLGESTVDTSALTGESVPRQVAPGDEVLSGFVNSEGKLRIRVSKLFAESSVVRILSLVQDAADRKAPTERFITKFASVYTPIIVAIALALAFVPPLLISGAELSDWVYRALVVLVISCPCALVLSIPLGYFGGIGGASRNHILVKGANYLDVLNRVSTVVLDKTGTVTKGVFRVTEVVPRNGHTAEELLRWAALAEAHSTHPIARSIREAHEGTTNGELVTEVTEDRGFGVRAIVDGRVVLAGSDRLLHREEISHTDCDVRGTVVYVTVDQTFVGYIVISDEVKDEAAGAVSELRSAGVDEIVMLTGDNRHIAADVAERIGVDHYFAELLPEEKVAKVEEMQRLLPDDRRLAFVGDGINDAPVLMCSDVGIAMGALGSDAAIEAADVVLMDDDVRRVPSAIRIGRHTRKIVLQNIVFALAVKSVFLIMGALGIATMWEAVIGDVGVSLLAVLNATRTLRA